MTLESCQLSTEEITITPTIPVVRTLRGLPRIAFWMPPDVVLVDSQSSCNMPLKEGTQSITVKIKAACKQGGVTEGLQTIVPVLSHINSRFWRPRNAHLPTIWVCFYIYNHIYYMSDKIHLYRPYDQHDEPCLRKTINSSNSFFFRFTCVKLSKGVLTRKSFKVISLPPFR